MSWAIRVPSTTCEETLNASERMDKFSPSVSCMSSFLYDETNIHVRRKQGWAASLWQVGGMLGSSAQLT